MIDIVIVAILTITYLSFVGLLLFCDQEDASQARLRLPRQSSDEAR